MQNFTYDLQILYRPNEGEHTSILNSNKKSTHNKIWFGKDTSKEHHNIDFLHTKIINSQRTLYIQRLLTYKGHCTYKDY